MLQVSVPGQMYPVEEFYLEDILTLTNYATLKKRGKRQQPPAAAAEVGLQQLTAQLAMGSTAAAATPAAEADDVVVENRWAPAPSTKLQLCK